MPRVLLVGENQSLLHTRGAVVAQTGAEILCARPNQVMSNQQIGSVDVLVICHTVDHQERQEFTSGLRRRWPGVRVIQLVKFDLESTLPAPHADEVAVAIDPANLVACIEAALSKGPQRDGREPSLA